MLSPSVWVLAWCLGEAPTVILTAGTGSILFLILGPRWSWPYILLAIFLCRHCWPCRAALHKSFPFFPHVVKSGHFSHHSPLTSHEIQPSFAGLSVNFVTSHIVTQHVQPFLLWCPVVLQILFSQWNHSLSQQPRILPAALTVCPWRGGVEGQLSRPPHWSQRLFGLAVQHEDKLWLQQKV